MLAGLPAGSPLAGGRSCLCAFFVVHALSGTCLAQDGVPAVNTCPLPPRPLPPLPSRRGAGVGRDAASGAGGGCARHAAAAHGARGEGGWGLLVRAPAPATLLTVPAPATHQVCRVPLELLGVCIPPCCLPGLLLASPALGCATAVRCTLPVPALASCRFGRGWAPRGAWRRWRRPGTNCGPTQRRRRCRWARGRDRVWLGLDRNRRPADRTGAGRTTAQQLQRWAVRLACAWPCQAWQALPACPRLQAPQQHSCYSAHSFQTCQRAHFNQTCRCVWWMMMRWSPTAASWR